MTELSTVISPPERDIETITREILDLQRQTRRLVLAYAIEVGRRLDEAKELLPYGDWGAWLRERVQFSERTAQRMMQLYDAYGADQIGIFGAELKPSALSDLSYTKALMLISVPENEREDFAEGVDAEHISTRELEQAIKERDEAQAKVKAADDAAMKLLSDIDEANEDKHELESALKSAQEAMEKAKSELAELRARPVEVAVQEPDEIAVRAEAEKLFAAAEDKHKAEIERLEKTLSDAEKKREKLEAKVKSAEEKAALAALEAKGERKAAELAAEPFKAEAERLRRELALSDPAAAQFKIYFNEAQSALGEMWKLLCAAPDDTADKLRAAFHALLKRWTMEAFGNDDDGLADNYVGPALAEDNHAD